LLRIHKRPSIPEGPGLAYVSLQTCRFFVCASLPMSTTIFLWPSYDKGSGFWTSIILVGWAMGLISYMLPDAVQRNLLCTCICLRRSKFKVSDDAAEIDYYSAQHFWPANMKYHKSHDLYKELPEAINPENLTPSTVFLSQSDIRNNYTNATEALADQTEEYGGVVAPSLVNYAKPRSKTKPSFTSVQAMPVMEPVRVMPVNNKSSKDQSFSSSGSPPVPKPLMNHAGNQAMPGLQNHARQDACTNAIPGAVGTPPGFVAAGPTWEFAVKDGWKRYDDDCHNFVEQRYQEYRANGGAPTRKIKTCGKEFTLNFKDMVQTVQGSHGKRDIRRSS